MAFRSSPQLPVEEVSAAYEQGATLTALSVSYGAAPSRIANELRKAGVVIRPKGARRRRMSEADWADLAAIAGMLADGNSIADVARHYGVSRQAADQQLASLCKRAIAHP